MGYMENRFSFLYARNSRVLKNSKMQDTTFIAILLDASEAFCVALFSVWKAGMAFLPLEASTPVQRLKK